MWRKISETSPGMRFHLAGTILSIAHVQTMRQDQAESRKALDEAYEIAQGLLESATEPDYTIAELFDRLGSGYSANADSDKAEECLNKALKELQRLMLTDSGYIRPWALVLDKVSSLLESAERKEARIQLYRGCAAFLGSIKDPPEAFEANRASMLHSVANLLVVRATTPQEIAEVNAAYHEAEIILERLASIDTRYSSDLESLRESIQWFRSTLPDERDHAVDNKN